MLLGSSYLKTSEGTGDNTGKQVKIINSSHLSKKHMRIRDSNIKVIVITEDI